MHLPSSGVAVNPIVTWGAQVDSPALAGGPRLAAAGAALACPERHRPSASEADDRAVPVPATLRRVGLLWTAAGEAHGPGPTSPAPRRVGPCLPAPASLRLATRLRQRVARRTRSRRPRAARDLCPRRKRKRAGPGDAHALPRRARPARPATFSKFTCMPGRASRARTCRAGPSGGRWDAGGDSPAGRGGSQWAPPGRRARGQRGPGRRAAARLALPGRRMRRRLGTDAPRARCMLMAGGRAMNYSAAARRGLARRGGRPGPRVPRRCEAATATSQTFPGRHRGCGPRGGAVPARARRPRFPRCRLFYVFCLGVGTCPRERVSLPTPSPPDRSGGGSTGDPGRRGRGKQSACGPRSPRRPPESGGRARAPGHPCSEGRSGLQPRPEYQRGRPRPPPCPLRVRTGRRPSWVPSSTAHYPGTARAGGAGGASSGFAARAPRLAPQPRVRVPAGTPPRALLASASPPRSPSRRPPRAGAPRRGDPAAFRFAPRGPRGQGGRARAPGPARPRRPGTEAAAGARSAAALQGAGCHDCGQRDARARSGPARGPVADRRSLQSPQPGARSPERAADSGQALRARPRGEQCAPRTSRRGPGTALGADSGSGLPPGWSSRMGDPAVASRTLRAPRSEGCPEGWESGPGTREPACGGRVETTSCFPDSGHRSCGEKFKAAAFALSEPDGDTAGPEPHGSFPGPPGGRDRLASRVRTRVRMPRRPRRLFPPAPQRRPSGSQTAEGPAWASGSRGCTRTQSHYSDTESFFGDPVPLPKHALAQSRMELTVPRRLRRPVGGQGPREARPPGSHPNVSVLVSPQPPAAGLGILTSVP
ncbi:hypothetical protein H8959_007251 [Pygathrix nigripes]